MNSTTAEHKQRLLTNSKSKWKVSPGEVQTLIEAARITVSPDQRSWFFMKIKKFGRKFSTQIDRMRVIAADERINYSELLPIRQLLLEALSTSKLIYSEIAEIEERQTEFLPISAINRLAEWNDDQIEVISGQLQKLDEAASWSDTLRELTDELRHKGTGSLATLTNLARRVLLDVQDTQIHELLLPCPGICLNSYLSRQFPKMDLTAFVSGIETARLTAWTATQLKIHSKNVELLTIAALLLDIGLLNIAETRRQSPGRLAVENPDVYDQHPSIGAAIVSAMPSLSFTVPLIISQHHEHLDGTGYPDGLRARHLSQESRLLGIVNRFLEFLKNAFQTAPDKAELPDRLSSISLAAEMLYKEAERGEWDLQLTIRFLECFELVVANEEDRKAEEMLLFGNRRKLIRKHKQHPGLPDPHSDFSRITPGDVRIPHFADGLGSRSSVSSRTRSAFPTMNQP